ncbi:MAG TPA: bifunctional 5,10-methylenetetrahydrofolate dehydrogenase/5,10-methenyltetrahydrofolate cyclohydrolase [bacterium]|nr:bifunctional 5,10-methylenetetrahydrofolate dehydrogenase/5,10-methenyltetrahydrofolate cyclohydrolase [bacterium]
MLDGTALAGARRGALAAQIGEFVERHGTAPCLAAILAGNDPASHAYVASKAKASGRVGIRSETFHLPADVPAAEYLALIDTLNRRTDVHGVLPQLPLPPQISADAVFATLDPDKDVDGLTPVNAGRLALGRPGLVPCTPLGVMALIDAAGVSPAGCEAVIVGRSNIVGKPTALLLLARHATVTLCHSRTTDLGAHTRRADILVSAVGHPRLIRADMVKPGAVVIDVGLSRLDGRIVGDVDFDAVREIARAVTPMPGGTGPMTIAMVLENTLAAARRQLEPART